MDELILPARVREGDFGGWMRDQMAARGISMRVLAMRTGISHTTISRLAADVRAPTLATAVAIVEVLGTPPVSGGLSSRSKARTAGEAFGSSRRNAWNRLRPSR